MSSRIHDALQYVDADDREIWIMAGMAIKSELGEDGFELWNEWSQRSTSYKVASAISSWRSFRGAGVSIGSLFHEAKVNGWRPAPDGEIRRETPEQIRARQVARAERLTREGAERAKELKAAAQKADWILRQCKLEQHTYLHAKGWPDATGSVWWPQDESNLLCIPMRADGALVGVQMIDREGAKHYLRGQRTSGAEHLINNSGPGALDWWVEGYATGLSLRDCLQALRLRYRIHVCFSAGNLKLMATCGVVVADRDDSRTGEKAAAATGLPFFLPSEGDFNDMHRAQGTFRTSQALRKWMLTRHEESACS